MNLPEELERYKKDFLQENAKMPINEAIVRHCAESVKHSVWVTGGSRAQADAVARKLLDEFDLDEK